MDCFDRRGTIWHECCLQMISEGKVCVCASSPFFLYPNPFFSQVEENGKIPRPDRQWYLMTAKRCVDLVNQKLSGAESAAQRSWRLCGLSSDLYGVNSNLRSILQTRGVDCGSKKSDSAAPIPQLAPSVAPTSPSPSSSVSIPPLSPHAAVVNPVV